MAVNILKKKISGALLCRHIYYGTERKWEYFSKNEDISQELIILGAYFVLGPSPEFPNTKLDMILSSNKESHEWLKKKQKEAAAQPGKPSWDHKVMSLMTKQKDKWAHIPDSTVEPSSQSG